jgi:Bacterial pre-peptidase C-terminal domain
VLTNGVAVGSISVAKGANRMFSLVIPSGKTSVTFKLSGGTGNADLYMRIGSAPTTTTYTSRSITSTNAETITRTSPVAGTYFVMVYGTAASSGATLLATYK